MKKALFYSLFLLSMTFCGLSFGMEPGNNVDQDVRHFATRVNHSKSLINWNIIPGIPMTSITVGREDKESITSDGSQFFPNTRAITSRHTESKITDSYNSTKIALFYCIRYTGLATMIGGLGFVIYNKFFKNN